EREAMDRRTERAAVSVEYALIAFLIAVGIMGAVLLLSQATQSSYRDSCTQFSAATEAGTDCIG
ncbi:MAG TPA: hypothetical protein VHG70_13770, partial [Nocardioidaceae bacterium]|nr:hypothetical protein [Nocardioidaceae bacterium]